MGGVASFFCHLCIRRIVHKKRLGWRKKMGVCSLRRRKGDHIQMDNRKKTLRLAAYYFTQISRLLLAIFILLIAADLILIGSMFIRRCQIQDPVSFQTIVSVAPHRLFSMRHTEPLLQGCCFIFCAISWMVRAFIPCAAFRWGRWASCGACLSHAFGHDFALGGAAFGDLFGVVGYTAWRCCFITCRAT